MLSFVNGPGKKRLLLIAVAAVMGLAILGAVFSVRQSTEPRSHPKPAEDGRTFLCDKCSAVFVRSEDQLPPGYLEQLQAGPAAAIDCPRCGASACALPPRQCPSCKKYYLTDAERYPGAAPPKDPQANRCPHCGTVPYEWHLKHVKPGV